MSRPLVAITAYPLNAEGRTHLPAEYYDAVRRAGGTALLIPPGETDPAGLLDAVDALVLTGGGDLHPESVGGETHPEVYGTSLERDALEVELARLAAERGTPTLAICRGMQILNVVLGGTIHLHLPDVVNGEVVHRAEPPGPIPHAVEIEADSLVGRVMGRTEAETTSWHHQALAELAPGLRCVARAADGTVEAVELAGHPFLLAVQWHPEITAAQDPTQQALFDALIRHARSVSA